MKRRYTGASFKPATRLLIEQADEILTEYAEQGYVLTLRQLYYQFVSRDILPNRHQSYKRLGSAVSAGRLAGLLDWAHIEDRTRFVRKTSTWRDPAEIVETCAEQFKVDAWKRQPFHVEVWIEKDALLGVIEDTCNELRVPYFSCRGYVSLSEMHGASQRLRRHAMSDQRPVILHLGDHDPSGIDMTRDIGDRLDVFGARVERVDRIALTLAQVEAGGYVPNYAKPSDSRYRAYVVELETEECWELDAIPPDELNTLIRDAVLALRDEDKWAEALAEEVEHRANLQTVADHWDEAVDHATEIEEE